MDSIQMVPVNWSPGAVPAGSYGLDGAEQTALAHELTPAIHSTAPYVPEGTVLPCIETTKANKPCTSPREGDTERCHGHNKAAEAAARRAQGD